MQQMGQKDVLRMVKMELKQNGMDMPRDQGAREALVNGTRAYILAVANDAVRSVFSARDFRVFPVDLICFSGLCRRRWRPTTRWTRS
jgi:hypothetical protein